MSRLKTSDVKAAFRIAAAFGFALTFFGPAMAANDVVVPTDPIAKAAFDVLDKHCARCHQEGRLDPAKAERPKKNFGNVLKLEEMIGNPNYILPGNPLASKLLKQIIDKEMPYDTIYEGNAPDMTEAEIKILSTWIESLGTRAAAACETRKFISHGDMIAIIAGDLEKVQRSRKKATRYLTLTHLKNACIDEDAMKVYRQGAIKLVNSLSRSSDVVRLEAVDPEGTILRINLDDLGWDDKDWNLILASYPYNTQPDTELSAVFDKSTATKMPYVRADWFANTASRPGMYEKLLKLAVDFPGLAKDHGVDLEGNIKKFIAQRSGFQKSGVSRNNRLIERHPSRNGYFWTSYDFAGNKARQSLFEFPLGPGGANSFEHDGGESIFSLPNGFQGYYLNTADGKALAEGPTQIVQDPTNKNLTVVNGISCMGCHDQGMRKAKDEVRAIVVQGRSFPRDIREQVEGLYPPTDKMDAIIAADGKRFTDAMYRAGLEPTLKLNGVEMITALMKRYEGDLDLTLAAAELGLTKKEFFEASRDADKKFRALIRRLEQGSIPRDQFEALYASLAADITDDSVVQGVGPAPGAAAAASPTTSTIVKSEDISLISDKSTYKQNELAVFTIKTSKDCFLTVTDVDDKGIGTVLFPNKFVQNNFVKAGTEFHLPPQGASFQFRLQDKGTETVTAVCSEKKNEVDGIRHDFNRSAFTSTGNYINTVARTRAIAVEGAGGAQVGGPRPQGGQPQQVAAPPKKPETPRELFRTAIKIKVD